MNQSGCIHAYECNECSKVEQLRPLLVGKQESSSESSATHQQHIVARNVMTFVHRAEESRQGTAPAHTVKKPRSTKLCSNTRSHICDEQRSIQQLEQIRANDARRDLH